MITHKLLGSRYLFDTLELDTNSQLMKTVIIIFTASIPLSLQACPPGSFTCDDQTTCIEADKVCNGKKDCPWGDTSDEAASLCNDCKMPNLAKCPGDYCGRSQTCK